MTQKMENPATVATCGAPSSSRCWQAGDDVSDNSKVPVEAQETRRRLPNRRAHEVHELEFHGQRFTLGVGRFANGAVAEIFLDAEKTSHMSAIARDAAVCLSIAAQHGVPLEAIRCAVTREVDGTAAGLVGAVLDFLEGAR